MWEMLFIISSSQMKTEIMKCTMLKGMSIQCSFPRWLSDKESACNGRCRFDSWVRRTPWRRKWQPTSVFLPGKSHRQRSLAGYSPWNRKELDMTELLHFSLSAWMKTRNPSHQTSKGQRLEAVFPWIFAPNEKCIYHRGRNCKCRY